MGFIFFFFGLEIDSPSLNRQLELYVFTSESCAPCAKFKRDYDENKDGLRGYVDKYFAEGENKKHYLEITWKEEGWSNNDIAAEYEGTTGNQLRGVPLFWVRGRSWSLGGYSKPMDVLEYLSRGKK